MLDVKECGWQGKTNNEIPEKAFIEKGVCLTCDKDFGTLVVYGHKPYYGIIFIRLRNLKPTNIIKSLGKLAENVEFTKEMIITPTDAGIRIRRS